jgi:ornithine cyclodeaminase/alanine dehydrogenase-like protein (mu-crystallin family)
MPTGTAFLLLPGGATSLNIMGARTYATPPGPSRVAAQHALEANSLVFVFDMRTAELLAVAAGEWINSLRTAGLGAVGTKYLANKTSSRVGVLGSGQLALASLMALRELFTIQSAKVFSRDPQRRAAFCEKLTRMAGFPVMPAHSPAEVLHDIDILVTATSAMKESGPVVDGRWLEEGTHVNCIGGYVQGGGRELDENAMARCNVLAVLNKEHVRYGGPSEDHPNANFAVPVKKGMINWDNVVEISDIIGNRAKGRQSPEDITFLDTRGMGAFDVALAHRAYELAMEKKTLGTKLNWGKRPDPGWRR